jgi:hypothetical protein
MVTALRARPAAPAGRAHRGEVLLRAPWYEAPGGAGLALHRFFDEDFIERFRQQVADRPEANEALSSWRAEDIAAPGILKLRRPVHRTFYVAACEAVCDRPGLPALGPEQIASAGLVIRRRTPGGEEGWMMAGGMPLGWRALDGEGDPETWRRLPPTRRGRTKPAAYTGEETRPLHPLLLRDGQGRLRCLLFGFVALGGDAVPLARASSPRAGEPPEELAWPFGLVNHPNGPPPWTIGTERQLRAGVAEEEIAALLRVLLFRFQLGTPEGGAVANAELWGVLDDLPFSTPVPGGLDAAGQRAHAAAHVVRRDGAPFTLGAWLRGLARSAEGCLPLVEALSAAAPTATVALPGLGGLDLLVPREKAGMLRAALALHGAAALRQLDTALPEPRYGRSDTCIARPFLRVRCEDGCERIVWGGASEPFRVALTFDPEATRPTLIQMPRLADLRKGSARGAAFAIPGDLMRHLVGLRSKDGAAAALAGNPPAASGPSFDFICSFSIPIITLCALILLMIVINLFNIVFRWLPWVVICLPLPR